MGGEGERDWWCVGGGGREWSSGVWGEWKGVNSFIPRPQPSHRRNFSNLDKIHMLEFPPLQVSEGF